MTMLKVLVSVKVPLLLMALPSTKPIALLLVAVLPVQVVVPALTVRPPDRVLQCAADGERRWRRWCWPRR